MKVSDMVSDFGDTIKSIVKIALLSRPVKLIGDKSNADKPLIILANGPSLRKTIDEHAEDLAKADTMAVNFAANAPEFTVLRPKFYVLADPHFYKAKNDPNVALLLDNLSKVNWEMTLIIDRRHKKSFLSELKVSDCVNIATFNLVGAEGFPAFESLVYSMSLAMPRPRNVLIPSIMSAIRLGYKKIYICGADHSWMKDITVTEDNCVVSGMNHFYKESKKEIDRARNEYRNYRLHDIVMSYYVAFRAYHKIAAFARKKNVDIINSTPGSYIDAFRRDSLPF